MGVLENIFSWSKSRDEEFRECQRKYYYDKYQSWGGWDKNAPKAIRDAYVLKNLKNRWAWKGESVHHEIENILKSLRLGQPVPFEKASQNLSQTMRRNYRDSKAKRNWDDPKRNIGLFEIEYEKEIADQVWKEFHDSSVECLKNFYDSPFYQELLVDDKKSWLLIEDLEEFNFEGTKIYVKLDFARRKNDFIEIYDWKTGKDDGGSNAQIQMGTYAIYAMKKWNLPIEKIRAFLFNLSGNPAVPNEQKLNQELISSTEKFIAASAHEMKKLLENPNKNIPLPIQAFLVTTNDRLCNSCNFYKICDRFVKR